MHDTVRDNVLTESQLHYAKSEFRLMDGALATDGEPFYTFPVANEQYSLVGTRSYNPATGVLAWVGDHRLSPVYPAHLWKKELKCLVVEDEVAVWAARHMGVPAFCILDRPCDIAISMLFSRFGVIEVVLPNTEAGCELAVELALSAKGEWLRFRGWSEHDKDGATVHTVLNVASQTRQAPLTIIETMPIIPAESLRVNGISPKLASLSISSVDLNDKAPAPTERKQKAPREPTLAKENKEYPTTAREQVTWFVQRIGQFDMFHTPSRDAFVRVDFGESKRPRYKTYRISGDEAAEFGDYLEIEAQTNEFFLDKAARDAVCRQIGAMARSLGRAVDAPPIRAHSIRDERGEVVYLDTCNKFDDVIEIDARGWRIREDQPVFFRRGVGMLPLAEPVRVRDEEREHWWRYFRKTLGLAEEQGFVFYVSWMLNAMRRPPGGAYSFASIHGPEDSGKTIRTTMGRSIVDPHETMVARMTHIETDRRNLTAMLEHNHCLAFGNLSGMSKSLSDDFCEIATGSAIPMRMMRTNKGYESVQAFAPMIFNGIADFMRRPDLKRRTVFIRLEPFAPGQQRNQLELMDDFHRHRGVFLGLLLDALSCALAHYNDREATSLDPVGVGDFCQLIEAASREPRGMPWHKNGTGYFWKLYRDSMKDESAKVSETSLLMQAIVDMFDEEVKGRNPVVLAPNDMYLRLRRYAMISTIGSERLARVVNGFSAKTLNDASPFWRKNKLIERDDVIANIPNVSHFQVFDNLNDYCKHELEKRFDPPIDRLGFPSNMTTAKAEIARITSPLRRIGIGFEHDPLRRKWVMSDPT